ncbi:LysR family transcriptional regulator [Edaphobacter modestus]|uniref:LysR substrate binding domain-containing protein n=1 Tax=Edaphobacter modestus TaxID=388466 RepID=A0A4Q7Z2A5_9BACT|nr:LysR family transcriptional regulator [Edaphobacter modestus]RZU43685.1 LysR substrate binding domain-containing protein [Edaphobacter modestus]
MIENFKLHVFRVVADTLNFSKAAEELHLSQPAVTSQVRSLEEGLGIALFDRVGRNATLTPAGKTLLPFVRQIETLSSDAIAALAPFGVQEGVELNIGASHAVGVYLLPRLLPALVREWPKLRIHIVSGSTSEILNASERKRIRCSEKDLGKLNPITVLRNAAVFGPAQLHRVLADHSTFQDEPFSRIFKHFAV